MLKRINTKKTQVMLSAISTGSSQDRGEFPCSICGRGVGANSIRCTTCNRWVHRRCSGIAGSLQAASIAFKCRKCTGLIARTSVAGDGTQLEVDGEAYEVVNKFCYLGDMLDSGGGAELAITTRIQCGWNKFRELSPFLSSRAPSLRMKGQVYEACVRTCMLHGSETWPMTKANEETLATADRRMIRSMCGESLRNRHTSAELLLLLGLEGMLDRLRRNRLRWFGHLERKADHDWIKKVWKEWEVEGTVPRGRPRKTWGATIRSDLNLLGVSPSDAEDRDKWRNIIGKSATQRAGRRTQND